MKWGLVNDIRAKWHRKFAWLPVVLLDGRRAWLESVQRRWLFKGRWHGPQLIDRWVYRAADDNKSELSS